MRRMQRFTAAVCFAAAMLFGCAAPQEPAQVLLLEHGDGNPRNSEGDFIKLKDGRILFIYTHFYGDGNDDDVAAYLASRYSADNGMTWSTQDKLEVENDGAQNVHSVSLQRLGDGRIALFYLLRNSYYELMPVMRTSEDEGKSWSEAKHCVTDTTAYFVMNNSRVLRTSSGRIILPLAAHPQTTWSNGQVGNSASAELMTVWSDDEGDTWHRGLHAPNPEGIVTQEPGLIEMRDGRIMMYCRTYKGCQYKCFSSDGGNSWTPLEPSNIASPCSPANIVKIPKTNDWLMVWNNNGQTQWRNPHTLAISHDEGQTWESITNLEDNPRGWYCYQAIHFIDNNRFLLGSCSVVREEGSGLNGLEDIRIFLIDCRWISAQNQ